MLVTKVNAFVNKRPSTNGLVPKNEVDSEKKNFETRY